MQKTIKIIVIVHALDLDDDAVISGFGKNVVGEIDIIARRGGLVVFAEVKARKDRAAAAEAITPSQTARIVRAAGAFLQAHPHFSNFDQRFDVILVCPWRLPVHLVDAWRPEH